MDRADIIQCGKSCQPNDKSCIQNRIQSISNTAISLPTFREFTKPEEIVFLRSPIPSNLFQTESTDIFYDILDGNVNNSFDIIKRLDHSMVVVSPCAREKRLPKSPSHKDAKQPAIMQTADTCGRVESCAEIFHKQAQGAPRALCVPSGASYRDQKLLQLKLDGGPPLVFAMSQTGWRTAGVDKSWTQTGAAGLHLDLPSGSGLE
ncbi:Fibulin-1 [Triplophysa tibetana]|uniref:Fibulin-1 n=1 Tax=Triplophysa tibetana TaxID=1572043 RepID=A0A5A9PR43_9TELE|nr:Fibulin-1 [Triplophysa tibetana]